MPIMAFKSEVKKCTHLCFRKVFLVNSLQSGKAWQACTQQTEQSNSNTNSAVVRHVYVAYSTCPASSAFI